MADLVLFHQEQRLPWLWLPTPVVWIENLHQKESDEQANLRRRQVMPSTLQPAGLVWHAWDTRDHTWIEDTPALEQWYNHWTAAQHIIV